MRRYGLGLFLLAVARVVLAAQQAAEPIYAQPGTEAPLALVAEIFLKKVETIAEDPELFSTWCESYRIDPTWPSAQRLASVYSEIETEFVSRLTEAHRLGALRTPDGWEPNEWKSEAVGRAIGSVYEALLLDGLDMKLRPFLLFIEDETASGFTSYSDRPFNKADAKRTDALFWTGLQSSSASGRALYAELGTQ
jgi:hypothetical protein